MLAQDINESNDLVVMATEDFDGVSIDFFRNDQVWLTREQIGRALGYGFPNVTIAKIHNKHPERFEGKSRLVNLTIHENDRWGGVREREAEVYVYNRLGIMEICRWSRQPKADAFMDWSFSKIDELMRTGSCEVVPKIVKDYLAMSEEDRAIAFFGKQKEVKFLETENKILKPKAGKYDEFMNSEGLFDWSALSSILNIGKNTMLKELRNRHYLQTNKGYRNQAYRYYEKLGWFVTIVETKYTNILDGNVFEQFRTYVTPKGLDKLVDLFKEWGY